MSEPVKESIPGSRSEQTNARINTGVPIFLRYEFFYLFIPVSLVLIFFWKTIFLGQAISNLDLLNQLDLIFNPGLKQSCLSINIDPTACLHMIPYQIFADRTLSTHTLPLWNDLTGCGRPFAADLASPSWAPFNLLFRANNPYIYNLGIVIKLALGVIGTYILARTAGISSCGSALTASCYFFCPRVLHLFELGGNTYFYPWVLLGFIKLANAPNLAKAALLALFVAFVFYSMHPEIFFVLILSGVFLSFASLWQIKIEKENKYRQLAKTAGSVTITGIISFLLAAPLILPFLEYLRNGACYKYSDTSCIVVSLSEYLINIFRPTMPATIFLGSTAALLIPAGLIAAYKQKSPFIALLPFLLIFSTRPPGFSSFLSHPPCSYLLPEYTLQPLILVFALIAGMGMDLFRSRIIPTSISTIVLAGSGLWIAFLVLAPRFFSMPTLFGISLDGLGAAGSNSRILLSLISTLIATLLIRYGLQRSALITALATAVLIILNFSSTYKISAEEVKPRPAFSMDASPTIRFLQSFPRRIVATGDRTLLANVHLMYGIQDLRSMGPLSPVRFAEFLKAAGAQYGDFNAFKFPLRPSRLLDLASVGFILSPSPIIDELEKTIPIPNDGYQSGSIIPGLRILESKLYFDSEDRSVIGDLFLRVHGNVSQRYEAQPVLVDKNGAVIDSAIATFLDSEKPSIAAHRLDIPISLAVPARVPPGEIYVSVRFKDLWSGQEIKPAETKAKCVGNTIILAHLPGNIDLAKINDAKKINNRRFKLRHESPSGMRVYENKTALPPAYLAHQCIFAASPKEALEEIQNKNFMPENDVVIEIPDINQKANGSQQKEVSPDKHNDRVTLTRDSASSVSITSSSSMPGWLVLTDTFYPGWKAVLDGQETPVVRANYLFRAIKMPAGNHNVIFVYEPSSFKFGLLLATLGLIFAAAISLPSIKNLFGKKSAPSVN